MKVCAIVVTYNRKELLQNCIEVLLKQTMPLDSIFIVDNASTDGTTEFLQERGWISSSEINDNEETLFEYKSENNKINIFYTRLDKNTGGAGGFNYGLKTAYKKGYDWYWIMDDDTEPLENSAENLFDLQLENCDKKVGFVCSRVLWKKDSSICVMTIPNISTFVNGLAFNSLNDENLLLVNSCAFVSVAFSHQALKECGFPIKDYFIWCDDCEFTSRIVKKGFLGIYNANSIAFHNTKQNLGSDIFNDDVSNIWKYKYGIRNEVHMQKLNKNLFRTAISRLIKMPLKILKNRKHDKFLFIKVNFEATFKGIFFNPKIEYGE